MNDNEYRLIITDYDIGHADGMVDASEGEYGHCDNIGEWFIKDVDEYLEGYKKGWHTGQQKA